MRSFSDWSALKWAERRGHEPPGTYDRLWKEEQELIAKERREAEAKAAAAAKPNWFRK